MLDVTNASLCFLLTWMVNITKAMIPIHYWQNQWDLGWNYRGICNTDTVGRIYQQNICSAFFVHKGFLLAKIRGNDRIVIPQSLMSTLKRQFHHSILGLHQPAALMHARISKLFCWSFGLEKLMIAGKTSCSFKATMKLTVFCEIRLTLNVKIAHFVSFVHGSPHRQWRTCTYLLEITG